MRLLALYLCLAVSPVSAWEFTPRPLCMLSQEQEGATVVVTYDPLVPKYTISLRRAEPWPKDAVFSIRFEGRRGITISTSRHQLSESGTVLTVTDRGFGNVLDGLQFSDTSTAFSGAVALAIPLDGAAKAVEKFRACTTALAV